MSDKSAPDNSVAAKWTPIIVGAVIAGIVVGQASSRMSLVGAVALGVVGGLAVAAGVHAAVKLLARRR